MSYFMIGMASAPEEADDIAFVAACTSDGEQASRIVDTLIREADYGQIYYSVEIDERIAPYAQFSFGFGFTTELVFS